LGGIAIFLNFLYGKATDTGNLLNLLSVFNATLYDFNILFCGKLSKFPTFSKKGNAT
jgi:hypothetical protein